MAAAGEDERPILAEVRAGDSEDAEARRSARRLPRRALAAVAVTLLTGAVAWKLGGGGDGSVRRAPRATAVAVDLQGKASAKVKKAVSSKVSGTETGAPCVRLPGVRLADPKAHPLATVDGKKSMPSATACAAECSKTRGCRQAVFAASAYGCYMFAGATSELAKGVEGIEPSDYFDYHESLYCGVDGAETLKVEAMEAVSKVKKSWGTLLSMWQADDDRKQKEYDQVQQTWDDAEKRAQETLASMKTWEKVNLLHGSEGGGGYAGFLKDWDVEGGIALTMNDGPQGYNNYQPRLSGTSTQLPALLSIAASFSPDVSRQYAEVVAEEFVTKGSNVLLGPDVEIVRAPLSGRSFETISGEDPYLGSQLVRPFVRAVHEKGIIATVKHWLDNNEEIYRMTMNVEVDDRPQHEIYMPVFKAAFDAGAGAVMCSYNRVYGVHACENPKLLTELLREDLGFRGYVVSDWGATHNGKKAADAGLDVEMPRGEAFKDLDTDQQAERIDQMASRILSSMYASGQIDGAFPEAGAFGKLDEDATSDAHREVAKQVIIDSTVLLKNDGSTLPLETKGKRIAMVGRYCDQAVESSYGQGAPYSGGGSGYVESNRVVTPFEGVSEHVKDAEKIWFANRTSEAESADIAVVCLVAHAEEGWDRQDMEVPDSKETIQALREMNPGMPIVVLAAVPGAVHTDWAKDANAVLVMFMPGEQVGPALAELLTGEASPAGRLPLTMPKSDESRFTTGQYPGECAGKQKWCDKMTATFSEGVLVGYRWNDAEGVPAAYPFGYGLSYTEFELRNPQVQCESEKAVVTLQVANTGARDGAAVPQLYVGFPSLNPALRQLRGFKKVHVPQGGLADVAFFLGAEDWSYYDEGEGQWKSAVAKGEKITVSLGFSSADLVWNATFSC